MDFINNGAALVKDGAAYLQDNAWYIVIMLVCGYYAKTNCEYKGTEVDESFVVRIT
jgi:hypothetical protein